MNLGYIRKIGSSEFETKNGKIKIALLKNKGHIHVKVSGSKRFTALTSVKAGLTQLELITLANYVYAQIETQNVAQNLRHANYAEVFGSIWLAT